MSAQKKARSLSWAVVAGAFILAGCGAQDGTQHAEKPAPANHPVKTSKPVQTVVTKNDDGRKTAWKVSVKSYAKKTVIPHEKGDSQIVSVKAPKGLVFQTVKFKITNTSDNPADPAMLFDTAIKTRDGQKFSPTMEDGQRMAIAQGASGVNVSKSVLPGKSIVKWFIATTAKKVTARSLLVTADSGGTTHKFPLNL